jgi:hypothetical protein
MDENLHGREWTRPLTPSKRRPVATPHDIDTVQPQKLVRGDATTVLRASKSSLELLLSSGVFQQSKLKQKLQDYLVSDQMVFDLARCYLGCFRSNELQLLYLFCQLFPALTILELKLNRLDALKPRNLQLLMKVCRSIVNLQVLNMSCNALGTVDYLQTRSICHGMSKLSTLNEINLSNSDFGKSTEYHFSFWAKALLKIPNLQHVNLSNNEFGIQNGCSWRLVLQFLRAISPKLKTLNLSWNNLGALEDNDWWLFLCFARKFYGELNLIHNNLNAERLKQLQQIYRHRPSRFNAETGGTLRNLIARTIWKHTEIYDYHSGTKTLNDMVLDHPVYDEFHHIMRQQSQFKP